MVKQTEVVTALRPRTMEISSNFCFFKSLAVFLIIALNCSVSAASEKQDAILKKVTSANNEFALNLYQSLAKNSSNLFFSPTSIFIALGMLYDGARGETASELRNTLGFEKAQLSPEEVDLSFNYLLNNVFVSTKNYTLTTANAILIDHRLKVLAEYRNKMQNYFQAKVQDVDFFKDRSKVEQLINYWVNSKTMGKIPRLVENLSPDTIMALLNAVYFKGLWEIPFDKESTRPAEFYNNGLKSKAKIVRTMHMSRRILYASSPDWQIVELPYIGKNLSMMILLPEEQKGLEDLENSLTIRQIIEVRETLRPTTVSISLPKLRMECSMNLKRHLESMGLKNIFRDADFSGMVEKLDVRVSNVEHKALVEITEEGTEAAGVTGVFIVPMRATWPKLFKVNRPFIFTIMDTQSNTLLFIGRVMSV
ncbi:serpin B6 [Nephila pilipes]|uniref:Serpin B6 n=1 Tax=Nephila pilipes TaxID=299642 RepID=A0A8X6TYY5_NEPPI|nr:serpin B6 [Nephila pilipes]